MESAVDQKQIVSHLLAKADKYRQFTRWIGDHETVRRILALTDEPKQSARPQANFGKVRISQNEAARMFNLDRSSEQQLVAGLVRLTMCTGYGYRGLRYD